MKLQLLVLGCLIALASGRGVQKFSRKATDLSSPFRTSGMSARDDDFDLCWGGRCWECDREDRCWRDSHCDDDERCINEYCCEYEGDHCSSNRHCDDDDDDDDDK